MRWKIPLQHKYPLPRSNVFQVLVKLFNGLISKHWILRHVHSSIQMSVTFGWHTGTNDVKQELTGHFSCWGVCVVCCNTLSAFHRLELLCIYLITRAQQRRLNYLLLLVFLWMLKGPTKSTTTNLCFLFCNFAPTTSLVCTTQWLTVRESPWH